MRLTCPNCGAQYEVPPDAIPPGGRDVQCSACGHHWREAGAAVLSPQPVPTQPVPTQPLPPEPWDAVPRAQDDDEEADDLADLEAAPIPQPAPQPAPATPPRRSASPMAIEILRAEAQREARARADGPDARPVVPLTDRPDEGPRIALTDRPPVSPGSDPVFPDPAPADPAPADPAPTELARADLAPIEQALRRRPPAIEEKAEMATAPIPVVPMPVPPAAQAPTPRTARRSDPRPEREIDPEAMNATLRPTSERVSERLAPLVPPRRRSSSFGSGFVTSVVVLALLAALYVFRPEIVESVPAAAVVLDPYAQAVDRGREWLDAQVAGFLTSGLPADTQAQ